MVHTSLTHRSPTHDYVSDLARFACFFRGLILAFDFACMLIHAINRCTAHGTLGREAEEGARDLRDRRVPKAIGMVQMATMSHLDWLVDTKHLHADRAFFVPPFPNRLNVFSLLREAIRRNAKEIASLFKVFDRGGLHFPVADRLELVVNISTHTLTVVAV